MDPSLSQTVDELNVVWVIVAAALVMFMQAGFALLEVGFSRGKNVAAGIAKVIANFSVATIVWWIAGFGIAFGGGAWFAGDSGFLFHFNQPISAGSLIEGNVTGSGAAFFVFQLMFCAVSLAIVWGTTLERIKFGAYMVYGVVFAAVIYPLVAHWIFGGGFLADIGAGVQDFAGSTVVHLTGATGALAALLLLGPRRGKYAADGTPRALPGHSMPLVGLGILILWLGWFGFNGGSTLGTSGSRFAEVILITQLAAAAGVLGAMATIYAKTKAIDVGMAGNGAIAGLVGITAPSGFVEFWAAPIIGVVAGVLVVLSVLAIEKRLDDPVGALSAHGVAGIWGTLSSGLFASPRLVGSPDVVGDPGLVYSGSFGQLGVQAVGIGATFTLVFVLSFATFWAIKKTIGLRVSDEDEDAGLDIAEHGMYGYPEQFIPQPEYAGIPREPTVAGTPLSGPPRPAAGIARSSANV